MYTEKQREEMADIINQAIERSIFAGQVEKMSKDDIYPKDDGKLIYLKVMFSAEGRDSITEIFGKTAVQRKQDQGQFFHFKSVDRALEILNTNTVQLTALEYHSANDHAEYSEFLKRCSYFRPFINGKIKELKQKSFILCLTKNAREDRFWKCYANEDKGVCLSMRFVPKKFEGYEFRDIAYDDGYTYEFINDIRSGFLMCFEKELFIDGVTKFAQFYKRGKYSWESESRICFDYCMYNYSAIFPVCKDMSDGKIEREYIVVPLANCFWSLNIEEIICGKNVTQDQIREIKSVALPLGMRVWKRR